MSEQKCRCYEEREVQAECCLGAEFYASARGAAAIIFDCDLYVKAEWPDVSVPALTLLRCLSSKLSESTGPRNQPAASHCAAQLQPTHASTCSLDPCDQDEALQDKLKIEISVR